jgi:two-component system response regulator HydG
MQGTGTRPTILLVEDYADSRQMMKLLLEGSDYSVLTAATGKEAISAAANNHVDLVLTDFSLPDMTGPSVVRSIRQVSNSSGRVPAVMLTAFDGYEYRGLAYEAGCDAFFLKPPNFDILKGTLDRLLQESRTARETNAFN